MKVTLRGEADNGDAVTELLMPAVRTVRERLKEYCFSTGDISMDDALAGLFSDRNLTLSLAESCSGGLIAKRITDIPGSSRYFCRGVVTYSNDAKMRLLGVPAELLNSCGAASSDCASTWPRGSGSLPAVISGWRSPG